MSAGAAAPAPAAVDQDGLVNVNVENITAQVPIAANVCDVSVGVLSRALQAGDSTCDATADAIATD